MVLRQGYSVKKILLIIVLSCFSSALTYADEAIPSQWGEYSSSSQEVEATTTKSSQSYSQSEKFDDNSRHKMKLQVDDNVSKCSAYSGQQMEECYSLVREAEVIKNSLYLRNQNN